MHDGSYNVAARADISLIKYGLYIPRHAANYDHFKEKMEDSEKAFKNQFIFSFQWS